MVNDSKIDVLDHGFVILRNLAGPVRRQGERYDADSTDIATAARMSFDAADLERTREADLRLLRYLWKHQHGTPFEMIEVWLEMKLPIFLARQFIRHRTASVNEVSGRYVELPEEFYLPIQFGNKPTDGAKQGQSGTPTPLINSKWRAGLKFHSQIAFKFYQEMLKEGIAPEHARMILPLNTYTHWLFKMDLRNLINLLKLRLDNHAQIEARIYAGAVLQLIADEIPDVMKIVMEEDDEST